MTDQLKRKCHNCGNVGNVKAIVCTGSMCDKDSYHNSSICKSCYFELCSCEEEGHLNSECLEDKQCPNHEKTVNLFKNWDKFNYNYNLKKGVVLA